MGDSIKNLRLFEDFLSESEKKEKKNTDHLLFNGNKLDFIVDGEVAKSWKAVSGRTQYHWYISPSTWEKRYKISPSEWAKVKNEGPVPQGEYTLGKTQARSIPDGWKKDANLVMSVLTRSVVSELDPKVKDESRHEFSDSTDVSYLGWGSHRWALIPKKGTNTFGRNSFYLHGGSAPGSIGCIDLVTDSPEFAKYYKDWMKKTGRSNIDVKVDYSTFDKNKPVEVDSQPYKMANFKGIDAWYASTNAAMADSLKKSKISDPSVLQKRSAKGR